MQIGLKKLDWYIIKKYWGSFFFTAFLFTLIALVIDFSEKAEKFVEASKPCRSHKYYYNTNSIISPLSMDCFGRYFH